ncbi:potassium-transporting ATPase subunit KdpC [Altererythrobacter xixiisoli]|uniref:Potassium-transporting ATPase KdpC subunit n=1 Tax=Croceibacterium xixiisoli TaxID=1476466 RepID=A0A6I4TX02_9SPHN|nr:potassium-transporting ATPase subunit KdpC [Croceibacterium xixiisoli]MXP00423.1 potassium-transporting ATPase subunit KdpC [Croceibacterium xixiisoli]
MGSDLKTAFRPAISMTILFALLLGIAYPLAMTGVGQALFPSQANGSLITQDGKIIGSSVVGQAFVGERYFHTRPSAAGADGYDGLASSGSNLGPTSQALIDRVAADVEQKRAQGVTEAVPADMVTASGSGLDPDISPDAALAQVSRVSAARGLAQVDVRDLVERSIQRPLLGFLGEDRVNVLELNRQLDRLGSTTAR